LRHLQCFLTRLYYDSSASCNMIAYVQVRCNDDINIKEEEHELHVSGKLDIELDMLKLLWSRHAFI